MIWLKTAEVYRRPSRVFAFSWSYSRAAHFRHTGGRFLTSARPKIFRHVRHERLRLPTSAILQEEDVSDAVDKATSQIESSSPMSRSFSALPESFENAILLSIVPFLWGSYSVVGKIVTSGDYPMPVSVLTFFSFLFAYLSIVVVRGTVEKEEHHDADTLWLTRRGGLELGLYLFTGSVLFLFGLTYTSASRAAFFVQLTTVFVPLASWLLGTKLSPQVFVACAIALGGAGVLSLDISPSLEALSPSLIGALNLGDLLAISAAIIFR